MNKSTKIWLNYLVGGAISALLLLNIYGQVSKQISGMEPGIWRQTGNNAYLWATIVLMFVNTSLEGCKWYLLTRHVAPLTYSKAFFSYLAGIAFSIVTPNRVGEYPGRIIYLGRNDTFRYLNVSILGITSQLWAVYIFGLAGLVYYNIEFTALIAKVALIFCVVANLFIAVIYFRFEAWLPVWEKVRWLRRFVLYGKLLKRVTGRKQVTILGISILRVAIFTAQYLFLLKWMNVNIPPAEGFCLSALFFWVMAVIPSIALTELGVRGEVSLFLFRHFTAANTIGVLTATSGIWFLNLIIPAIVGSILILRMKLLR